MTRVLRIMGYYKGMPRGEWEVLPIQAQILSVLTGYLLDVRSVRGEIDRREMCGQWVAGALGEGGAFAMRTAEERAERAAATSDDEVCTLPSACAS